MFKRTFLILSCVALLPACVLTQTLSGDTYSRGQARTMQTVLEGTIVSIRSVTLDGTSSGAGAVAGGALTGVAGGAIGHGYGSVAAGVAGTVIGAFAGAAIEKAATTKEGLEITVRLQRGDTIAIVQEAGNDKFKRGDRVRVLYSANGEARVTPAY